MKKIVLAAIIVGAATAGLFIYLRDYYRKPESLSDAAEDAGEATGNALYIMNRHASRAERIADGLLN